LRIPLFYSRDSKPGGGGGRTATGKVRENDVKIDSQLLSSRIIHIKLRSNFRLKIIREFREE
jgi:hypothetical protein